MSWVNAVAGSLATLASYGSTDATQFEDVIEKSKKEEVLAKEKAAKERAVYLPTHGTGQTGNAMEAGTPWSRTTFKFAYNQVELLRGGICTSLAKAAVWVLIKDRDTGPRVEVVAIKNHVYVIVGRVGGYEKDNKIPAKSTWGDAVIVDVWLGAMGWKHIYRPSEYPDWCAVDLELITAREAS